MTELLSQLENVITEFGFTIEKDMRKIKDIKSGKLIDSPAGAFIYAKAGDIELKFESYKVLPFTTLGEVYFSNGNNIARIEVVDGKMMATSEQNRTPVEIQDAQTYLRPLLRDKIPASYSHRQAI